MSAPHDLLAWQVEAAKLPQPVHEYRFARDYGRRFRFDLCWPERRVAVEVDGGLFSGGRHVRGAGALSDCEKFSIAAAMGWRVLRVAPQHVKSGQALRWIEQALSWGEREGANG